MQATLNITPEQIEKLIKITKEDEELHTLYWQLLGIDFVGGDDDGFIGSN